MATIHPHKGYLNTRFSIHLTGNESVLYKIYPGDKESEIILQGEAIPNKPQSFTISTPGNFTVKFEDGTESPLLVEDGYRFGGSRNKKAFIFDKCPWAFIVMCDRTYFYNRETEESYVERISPDNVIEISKDYVFFESTDQKEKMLYSIKEQKPLLDISDVVMFNEHAVIWKEEYKREGNSKPITKVNVFSLHSQEVIYEHEVEGIHAGNDEIFLISKNHILRAHLDESFAVQTIIPNHQGSIIAVVDSKIAVTYKEVLGIREIFVYDVLSETLIGSMQLEGALARVNDVTLIKVEERKNNIKQAAILDSEFPEATITADYAELNFFPSAWRIFYSIKTTSVIKSKSRFETNTVSLLGALNADLNIPLKDFDGRGVFFNSAFCFYNNHESYVQGKNSSGAGYNTNGNVYIHNNTIILKYSDNIRVLSSNGYWDNVQKGDFDLSYFEEYNVIRNKEMGPQYGFGERKLSGTLVHYLLPYKYLSSDNYIIYPGGRIFEKGEIPEVHSEEFNYGMKIGKNGISIIDIRQKSEKPILDLLFDSSEYRNVLFSEDGSSIMFQDSKATSVLEYASGEITEFKCESYIQQFNGMRPHFKFRDDFREDARCVELINPINGKIIPVNDLSNHVFVSPDCRLYADTALGAYEYYYDLLNKKEISLEDVNQLREELEWVSPYSIDNQTNVAVSARRKDFIHRNLYKLQRINGEKCWSFKDEQTFIRCFAESNIIDAWNNNSFFDFLYEVRGRVVIRDMTTTKEVARIDLGPALWFLNYVSFSFDNRYVCIGGRYPNGSRYGGLFLIYDLEKKECLCKKTNSYAIWTTAFNRDGMIVAYSSTPDLYYSSSPKSYKEPQMINGYSFLSFSPDGKYLALSNKRYVSSLSGRNDWGHRQTSDVYVCSSSNPKDVLAHFNDLSGEGIADSAQNKSVASVSFSIDNKKLMMVGKDGVVVIRNLHLEN